MKRRRFFKAVAALPAAGALVGQQQAPPPPQSQGSPNLQQPVQPPGAGRGAGGGRFGAGNIPKFELTAADQVGDPDAKFFTPAQFAALRRFADLLMPPLKGNPGSVECGAPEFLDFLIGQSPADRQKLYRNGLDMLNARAKKQYNKAFSELDAAQADAIVRPLLSPIPWVHDTPKDPNVAFVNEAHRDIRTATQNSREWATAGAGSGRRGGGFGGGGSYLLPIDPIYKG